MPALLNPPVPSAAKPRLRWHQLYGSAAALALAEATRGDRRLYVVVVDAARELERFTAELREKMAAGEPVGPQIALYNAAQAERAVPEWRAILDALQAQPGLDGPVGFWGVSMGSATGVPLAAAEPRITAAVFGLAGHETLGEAAARITIPVEFLLQWDDELIPRESGLALFDAFASREKSMHVNPGRHGDVPMFEVESSLRFFGRHLRPGGSPGDGG